MKKSKKISVGEAFRGLKRIVKDEYMLNLYESDDGNFETMKKANNVFDKVFLSIQMRFIIWIVGIAIGIILYYYFTYRGLGFWFAFPLSFLLSYMTKKSLQLLRVALLTKMRQQKL